MNIHNWITEQQFKKIQKAIEKKEPFEFAKEINRFRVVISSDVLKDIELANDIWNGETYLIHYNFGKQYGDYHGWGFADNSKKYKNKFESFESFANFFDSQVERELENYEPYRNMDIQISLF